MKAVRRHSYGPPDVLEVVDVDTPEPIADQVLVRVAAASVNTADLDLLLGVPRAGRVLSGWRRPKSPRVGVDVVGRVEAVGPEAKTLSVGDEVWADLFQYGGGAFAEYVRLPEKAFTPRPAGLVAEVAATVPHSGLLALQAVSAAGQLADKNVLINGAGGCVGPFAIQIAKARGATVTGVDHTGKLDLMREAGADDVVDFTRQDVTRGADRFDVVVDIAATRSPLRFLRILTPRGRYVQVARSLAGFISTATIGAFVAKLAGKKIGNFNWVPSQDADLKVMAELIESGQVQPLIDRRYSLDEVPAAYQDLVDGTLRGKAIILP